MEGRTVYRAATITQSDALKMFTSECKGCGEGRPMHLGFVFPFLSSKSCEALNPLVWMLGLGILYPISVIEYLSPANHYHFRHFCFLVHIYTSAKSESFLSHMFCVGSND